MSIIISKYINTRLHNFPMLVKDNYMAYTIIYTFYFFIYTTLQIAWRFIWDVLA